MSPPCLFAARLFATCLLAFSVLAARPAAAQPAADRPAADAAWQGDLVARLRVGPAYLSVNEDFDESPDQAYSGAGFAFEAEIGGWLTSNVSLCAELSGALALGASDNAADLSTAAIGPSITYTLHPGSIYLGVDPALTIVRTSATDHFFLAKNWGSNYFGLGIGFVVGEEWRVSDRWRLGVAAQARYAAATGDGPFVTMSEYALSFSATHD